MKTMLAVDEALALIRSCCAPLAIEQVPLADAFGRVLAAPVDAPRNLPPFSNSAMDGFALRWREGLVLPLEPFLRRLPVGDRFELYWMDHLPRAGSCTMSSVVGGQSAKSACEARRLPPVLRKLYGVA